MHSALQRSPKNRDLPFAGPVVNKLRKLVIALAGPNYPRALIKSALDVITRDQRLEEARTKLAATAVDESHRAKSLATATQIADGAGSVEDFARIGTVTVAAELAQHRSSVIEFQAKIRREAAGLYQQLAPVALAAIIDLRERQEKAELGTATVLGIDFVPSSGLRAIASVEILLRENLANKPTATAFEDKPVEVSIGFLIPDDLRK